MNTDMVPVSQVAVTAGAIDRTELAWPERAAGLKIVDAATLAIADEERGACKDLIAKAHERHDPTCASAYKTWQLKCEERRLDIEPLEAAVGTYDRNKIEFHRLEKQREREAQRKLEQASYTESVTEVEKAVEHIEATGGTPVEVRSVAERPVPIPIAPTKVTETPAAAVRSKAAPVLENWKGEITDQFAFVMHAVLGVEPPKEVLAWVNSHVRRDLLVLLQPNKGAILSTARVVKNTTEIPGLRIYDEGKVQSTPKKAVA